MTDPGMSEFLTIFSSCLRKSLMSVKNSPVRWPVTGHLHPSAALNEVLTRDDWQWEAGKA